MRPINPIARKCVPINLAVSGLLQQKKPAVGDHCGFFRHEPSELRQLLHANVQLPVGVNDLTFVGCRQVDAGFARVAFTFHPTLVQHCARST